MNKRITRIDELARDIPPPRDLWPGIAAAIEADKAQAAQEQAAGRAASAQRSRWLPAAGLAAAVALVAIGVLIGQNLGSNTQVLIEPTLVNSTTPGKPEVIHTAVQRDAEYRKQRETLVAEVNAKLKTMPAAERAKVEASLTTLQKSIAEIEAALGKDPANALLQELFVNSCQEEMRALTTVRDSGSQEI